MGRWDRGVRVGANGNRFAVPDTFTGPQTAWAVVGVIMVATVALTIITIWGFSRTWTNGDRITSLSNEVQVMDDAITLMLNMTKDDVLELFGNVTDLDARVDVLETNVDQSVTTTSTPTFSAAIGLGAVQALSGGGALVVDLTSRNTFVDTTAGVTTLTIGSGTDGQIKRIVKVGGGATTATMTQAANDLEPAITTSIVWDADGQVAEMMWITPLAYWILLSTSPAPLGPPTIT